MCVLQRCWSIGLMFVCTATVPAGEAPTAVDVRAATARAIPFLETEGVAWMRDRACITCHQIPSMVWSLNEVRRRGFDVDGAKLDEWNRWAVDNGLKRAVYHQLTETDLAELGESDMSAEQVEKLAVLKDKVYVFEQDFRDALAEQLSADVVRQHAATLMTKAAKTKQGAGGGNTQNQHAALLLSGAANVVPDGAAVRQSLVAALVKAQKPDGAWVAAGQFLAQQRPAEETVEVVTRWTVLALGEVADLSAPDGEAVAKAEARLKEQTGDVVSTEALLLRALFARRRGDDVECRKLSDALLALQHDDGGWGWLRDRATSDAYTTGQVLYGLHYLGRDAADPAVQKGVGYLLKAQGDDGVWRLSRTVISKGTKKDNAPGDAIYTYWTTGWAVLGLLQSLPE